MEINQERLAKWREAYLEGLTWAVKLYPQDYGYGLADVPRVHANMMESFIKGDYNHDGRGIKRACRTLGIPHTRKAIEAFLKGE